MTSNRGNFISRFRFDILRRNETHKNGGTWQMQDKVVQLSIIFFFALPKTTSQDTVSHYIIS